MEEIYVNDKFLKSDKQIPSTINPTGPRSSKRRFYAGVFLSLGLLSVFLMVGLVITGIYLHDSTTSTRFSSMTEENDHVKANLSTMSSKLSSMTHERDDLKTNLSSMTHERDDLKTNLSSMTHERDDLKTNLSSMTHERDDLKAKLSSMTQERDNLHDRLTKNTEELERLQSLLKQKKSCPAGWRMFSCSCYLLSGSSGSWDAARKDCRDRGADLVVIDRPEEQDFLSNFTQRFTWIGLSDTQEEGKWKWVDGTPLTQTYWATGQPDNGGGDPKWGEEDCGHIRDGYTTSWNDLLCAKSLRWVCEKVP